LARWALRVKARDIKEFVERQREPVQRLKREHWAAQARGQSALSTLDASHALHEHARRVRPDFPSDQYLADDLIHHLHLKRMLDRAAPAFTIRRPPPPPPKVTAPGKRPKMLPKR
jgi:hypothetical protein